MFFLFSVLVVLCTKHAGKSSDSSVGRAIHRDGSQIKAAHVVNFSPQFLLTDLVLSHNEMWRNIDVQIYLLQNISFCFHSDRRAIRAAFKNKQRGALLTTHYMEEAEAVCDRVAIMVSGQLR